MMVIIALFPLTLATVILANKARDESLGLVRQDPQNPQTVQQTQMHDLISAAEQLRQAGKPMESLDKLDQALTLSQTLGDHKTEANILDYTGRVHGDLGQSDQALNYFNRALKLSQDDHLADEEAIVCNDLGNLHTRIGDTEKAMRFYNDSLSISRQSNNPLGIASALVGLGDLYGIANDFRRAIENYQQATEILHDNHALQEEAFIRQRMNEAREVMARELRQDGDTRYQEGNLKKALETYQKALAVRRDELAAIRDAHNLKAQALLYGIVGKIYLKWGDKENASLNLKHGLSIIQQVPDDRTARVIEADLLGNIGAVSKSLEGDPHKAIDFFLKALKVFQDIKDFEGQARFLNALGTAHDALGEKEKGVEYYKQAFAISEANNIKTEKARSLAYIGSDYEELGQQEKAIESLNQAVQLAANDPDSPPKAEAWSLFGNVYRHSGDLKHALDCYERSLRIYQVIHDKPDEIKLLGRVGGVYSELGDNTTANGFYKDALKAWQAIDERGDETDLLNEIGWLYLTTGETDTALQTFNRALESSQNLHDSKGLQAALNNLSATYIQLGQFNQAKAGLERSLRLATDRNDVPAECNVLNNLSALYLLLDDTQKALEYANKSLRISRTSNLRLMQTASLSILGDLYRVLKDWSKALPYLNEALQISRDTKNPVGLVVSLNNLGLVYGGMGNYPNARQNFEEALNVSRQSGMRSLEIRILNNLGHLDLDVALRSLANSKDLTASVRATSITLASVLDRFNEALLAARATKDRYIEVAILNSLGFTYSLSGDKQKASDLYYQAVSLSRMYSYRGGEATSLENLGSVSEDQGNPSAALDDYLRAISLEESIRESARIEEFKTQLAEQTVDVYQRAILLERRIGKNTEAFELSERARARTLLDQLGNARINPRGSADPQLREKERVLRLNIEGNELRLKQQRMKPDSGESSGIVEKKLADEQDQYMVILNNLKAADPEYASLRSVDTLNLTNVQKLLTKDTTLLSFLVTDDKTLVFVITSDSFQTIDLPVKKDALIKTVHSFRSFDDTSEAYPESLKRLYAWLIAPIRDSIKTSRVGIIPHGVLHYVPFSALTDGHDYFGEKYTLFNLPSASVLPYVFNKNRPKGRAMLALAESRAEGLPVLEKADKEATLIAQIYGTLALVTPNATKSTLRNRARECTILHIAAHAELNPNNPLFSRIYLAPDKDDSGMLDVGEVYELDLRRANLVVLSACETELGAQSSGDDIVGMNRAFLYAGTPTVISSLWTVDDQSTGLLMESFYKHLKGGMSKAAALQAAQRELRAKYPNPFYWAPFVLTGDPE